MLILSSNCIHWVENKNQLKSLLSEVEGDYLIEEFIDADIVTYDGLTDYEGNIIAAISDAKTSTMPTAMPRSSPPSGTVW